MPKYLIERTVPGAGCLKAADLQAIAQRSMCALEHMDPKYRWHHSYVAGDKFYCVHEAANEELIREHARRGGFPVDRIIEIAAVISPKTAEERSLIPAGG